jgi:hypothetical protein
MMEGMLRGRRATRVLQRIDRPEVIGLSVVLAVLCAVGGLVTPFWLAVVVAAQLALGGAGAVRLIGPARPGLGFARYATTAMAAVSLVLFGRLIPPGAGLLLTPLAAVLIWSVLWLELRFARGVAARTMLDLALVGIVFLTAAGIWHVFGTDTWPPPLALVLVVVLVLGVRAAEARGVSGIEAIGQALLHVLAVGQAGAAVALLQLPGVAGPAVVALAFYAWGGAVEAREEGASLRSVALEFGAIALLGVIVAFLLDQLI